MTHEAASGRELIEREARRISPAIRARMPQWVRENPTAAIIFADGHVAGVRALSNALAPMTPHERDRAVSDLLGRQSAEDVVSAALEGAREQARRE